MEKTSMQECDLKCCVKQLNVYASKIWNESIKPHPTTYILSMIIIFVTLVLVEKSQVAIALTAIFAPIFAIHNFYLQQRTARIQKIYYEDSLLDLLNHLDESNNIATKNLSFCMTYINFINNDLKIKKSISETTMKMLDDLLIQVKNISLYSSYKQEVVITLFKTEGYKLYQWVRKCDEDIINFNSFCVERLTNLRANLPSNEETIRKAEREFSNYFALISRHHLLMYLLNKIVQKIGILDFKSREQIMSFISSEPSIINTLKKIDEVLKILFGWFKLQENEFVSYLKNEKGNHYKLLLDRPGSPIIEECSSPLSTDEVKIIIKDIDLLNAIITINGKEELYSKLQLGMANMVAFDEKPLFYPTARSFLEF